MSESIGRAKVGEWLAAHDEAWRSNDPIAIGELFSEDGVYQLGPWEGPWRGMRGPLMGRAAIVEGWTKGFDPQERFETSSEILAIEGRRAVVRRLITYLVPDGSVGERYSCAWLLDFDAEGRCRDYQEWVRLRAASLIRGPFTGRIEHPAERSSWGCVVSTGPALQGTRAEVAVRPRKSGGKTKYLATARTLSPSPLRR